MKKRILAFVLSMVMIALSLEFPGLAYDRNEEPSKADVPVYVRQEDGSYERVTVSEADAETEAEQELSKKEKIEAQGARLPTPTGLKWHTFYDGHETHQFNGVMSWKPVNEAAGYKVSLYRDGKRICYIWRGGWRDANLGDESDEYEDMLEQFDKSGDYQFRIQALKNYNRKELKGSNEDSAEALSELFKYLYSE